MDHLLSSSARCLSFFLIPITILWVSKAQVHSVSFGHLLYARNCLGIGDFLLNEK